MAAAGTTTAIHHWGEESPPPTLKAGEIHVWLAWVDGQQDEGFWELLSDEEKRRAARLLNPQRSKRFVVTHGILRRLLGAYLGQDPGALTFRSGSQGKPALVGAAEKMLSFNLSHSEDMAAYVIAKGRDVGIDIERIRPIDDLESMAAMALSSSEWNNIKEETAEERLRHFYVLWTRKEAILKVTGKGLTVSMKAVKLLNFKSTPETSEILLPDGRKCQVIDLPLDEGYIGAVATAPEV